MYRTWFAVILFSFLPLAAARGQSAANYEGAPSDVWLARLKDQDETVRLRAAYALGQIQPVAQETVPALIKAVDDLKQEVRWYAADSLGRLGPTAKSGVAVLLAGVNEKLPDGKPANDLPFSLAAARAFGRIGPASEEAVPWLVETLRDPHPPLRVTAALALWRIKKHPNALPALQEALAESTGESSYLASMALLELGPAARPAAPALVKALSHASPDARRAAARVLGKLGPEMITPLSKALGGTLKSESAQESAIAALSFLLDDARQNVVYNPRAAKEEFATSEKNCVEVALPVLIKLFDEPNDGIRLAAARAASKIGLPAVPMLLAALGGESETARTAAADALARLEGELPKGAPSASLADLQRRLAGPFIAALKIREPAVRAPALRLFAELSWGPEAKEALPLLRDALKSEDPLIRRNAAKGLEQVQKEAPSGGTPRGKPDPR